MPDLELPLLQLSLSGVAQGTEQSSSGPEHAGEAGSNAAAETGTEQLLQLVLSGAWVQALRHPAVQSLLGVHDVLDEEMQRDKGGEGGLSAAYYAWLQQRLHGGEAGQAIRAAAAAGAGAAALCEVALLAAVACLGIFLQHNLTGPTHDTGSTPSPVDLFTRHSAAPEAEAVTPADGSGTGSAAGPAAAGLGEGSADPHERWAANALQVDGEETLGRSRHLQYLLLAELLLLGPLLQQQQPHQQGSTAPEAQAEPVSATDQQQQGGQAQFCDLLQQQPPRQRRLPPPPPAGPSSNGNHSSSTAATPSTPAISTSAVGDVALEPPRPVLEPGGVEALLRRRLPSWAWWALRATALHQHVLSGRAPTLLRRADLLIGELQHWVEQGCDGPKDRTVEQGASGPLSLAGRPHLQGSLFIEMALLQYAYGYIDPAQRYMQKAGELLGLEVELTGALGRRTVHQVEAKAQLVVHATRQRQQASAGQQQQQPSRDSAGDGDIGVPKAQLGLEGAGAAAAAAAQGGDGGGGRETEGLQVDEDVFTAPVLVGEEGQVLESRYSGAEQALLLAWCTHVRKGTAHDELQAWQMAPYVEAVLGQERSQFMLQASATLHKLRHERARPRTRERALLRAEQLAEALAMVPAPSPERQQGSSPEPQAAAEPAGSGGAGAAASQASAAAASAAAVLRLRYAFSVWFPLQVALKKEIAEQYIAMGFVGAALQTLEELELWDNLIVCYRLLDKKTMAEELIQKRIKVTPDDPKLWNALGDLHMDDAHYREAWERSGHRNARAQRSLGRSALRRKDWAAAAEHFTLAVSLNPLHVESWFSLGYAYVKAEQPEQALKAFTRVTQQEPDHGEAWNNIAALWMQLQRYKEAFSALSECVKHKRDSWQIWENYAYVAVLSGNYAPATRGLGQVLELSNGQRLKVEVLRRLVDEFERPTGGEQHKAAGPSVVEVLRGLVEELERPVGGQQQQAAAPSAAVSEAQQASAEEGGAQAQAEGVEDEGGEGVSSSVGDDFVLDVPGVPLLAAVPLTGQDAGDGGDAGEGQEDATGAAARGREREAREQAARARRQLTAQVGTLLKRTVNSSCCSPEVWGLLGRWHGVQGELEARKEALLKQVRGLMTTSFRADEAQFVAMARASLDLCRAYVDLFRAGAAAAAAAAGAGAPEGATAAAGQEAAAANSVSAKSKQTPAGGVRDLAAARMHLRSVLKQCEGRFSEHALFADMRELLDEVTALEQAAALPSVAEQER